MATWSLADRSCDCDSSEDDDSDDDDDTDDGDGKEEAAVVFGVTPEEVTFEK